MYKYSDFLTKNCLLVLRCCSMLWSWSVLRMWPPVASFVTGGKQTPSNDAGFRLTEPSLDEKRNKSDFSLIVRKNNATTSENSLGKTATYVRPNDSWRVSTNSTAVRRVAVCVRHVRFSEIIPYRVVTTSTILLCFAAYIYYYTAWVPHIKH